MAYFCVCGARVFIQGERCSNCRAASLRGNLRAAAIPRAPAVVPAAAVVPAVALAPAAAAAPAPAQVLAAGTLPLGAALQLKCRGSRQLAWIDVVHNSTLYVLKDTTVEFKVDSAGGDANLHRQINYETAQWGGTAPRAAGTSATKPINFTANSANTAAPSTVTVAFGGQNLQVNVIVYTLNPVSTPADNFNGRSQTDLGVDERVSLSFTTTPAGVTAANAGGLRWKIGGGAAADRNQTGLLHNAATHIAPPANDGLADYIAPCRILLANVQNVQSSKEVTLQLSVIAGPSIGLGPTLTFRVHRPNAHMTPLPNQPPHHFSRAPHLNTPSAGFYGQIFFTPKTVSFRTLRWREGVGRLEESGVLQGAVPRIINHVPTVLANNVHGTVTNGNFATGCSVNQVDTVRGVGVSNYAAGGSSTTEVGTQKWPIKWEYTYAAPDAANPNGPPANAANWTNDWIGMQIAHHIGKMFQNGRFEIFKGHVGCLECMRPISREPNDPHHWP